MAEANGGNNLDIGAELEIPFPMIDVELMDDEMMDFQYAHQLAQELQMEEDYLEYLEEHNVMGIGAQPGEQDVLPIQRVVWSVVKNNTVESSKLAADMNRYNVLYVVSSLFNFFEAFYNLFEKGLVHGSYVIRLISWAILLLVLVKLGLMKYC